MATEVGSRRITDGGGLLRSTPHPEPPASRRWLFAIWIGVAAIAAVMLLFGERGPGPLANPSPSPDAFQAGRGLYTNPPLFGVHYWPQIFEVASALLAGTLLVIFSRLCWRERRLHPGMTMLLAATGMYLFDPIFNWAWYFPTDPRFLHWPIDWPYVSIVPTVEPMLFMPAYTFWLLIPALIAYGVWKWLLGRPRLAHSWIHRRPLLALILVGSAVAIPWDFCGFWLGTVTEVFIFSQAWQPLVRHGLSDQQHLLWEPILFPPIITCTCVLFAYRDDKGNIIPHRIAQRLRSFRRFPRLTEVTVAWGILAVIYASTLGAASLAFRVFTTPSTLANPWPYADTQVYDPDGLYEKAGHPGPYRR